MERFVFGARELACRELFVLLSLFFETTRFGRSIVGPLTNERVNATMKAFDKKKMAIKNSHTKGEMEVLDNEYAASKAPSLTFQQALELAKAHQEQQSHEKTT